MKALKHCLSLLDFETDDLKKLINLAKAIKADPSAYSDVLKGKSIATLYEKQSLRTRVTFDVGINKLGGHAVYLDQSNGQLGSRESVKDFATNLSQWVDAIVARVNAHETLDEFKLFSKVPVINSLSDWYHPCQALADTLTLSEYYSDLSECTLSYIGDGNNVAHSLLNAGALVGFNVNVITPVGREVNAKVLSFAKSVAEVKGIKINTGNDLELLNSTDVIYTDTWVSMGDDTPLTQVKAEFMDYQVNETLMQTYNIKHFMHCQPVHRGFEATDEVCDGEGSLMLPQSNNRLWAQCALLVYLIAPEYLTV